MNPIKTITTAQITTLLRHLEASNGTSHQRRLGMRNVAIALLMLDAGLRENEVSHLLVADLYWQGIPRETIEIRPEIAKYHVGGQIPTSIPLRAALTEYAIAWMPPNTVAPHDWAFRSYNIVYRISTRQIRRMIHNAGTIALGIELNAHMLRHTFIDRLRRCTDLPTVQRLARHKDIRSTMIYTHPAQTEMAAAIASMSAPTQERTK